MFKHWGWPWRMLAREETLASLAARRGVDRIVKLGRMHVFAPPWDGVDLIGRWCAWFAMCPRVYDPSWRGLTPTYW